MEVQILNNNSGFDGGIHIFNDVVPVISINEVISSPTIEVWQTTPDALEAVKLDPAVIEAQVTLEADPVTPPPTPDQASARCTFEDQDNIASGVNSQPDIPSPSSTCSSPSWPSSSSSSSQSLTMEQSFEQMLNMQRMALQSLSPELLGLFMKYVAMLRSQRAVLQRNLECAFCKRNGEPSSWYASHVLKNRRGRVQCPVLRSLRCPRCGATGDYAHTIKYCPENYDAGLRSPSSVRSFFL